MSEEIIIKTETVNVQDLQGREKQIYDYAYKKGVRDALDENLRKKHAVWTTIAFLVCVGIVWAAIHFNFLQP